METRAHPTHHDHYRPNRAVWGVAIGLAGVFLCVFVAMVNTGESAVLRVVKVSALGTGAVAFVAGTILAALTEITHLFARCVTCGRLLRRSRMDARQSYYPCRRCNVTWTPVPRGVRLIWRRRPRVLASTHRQVTAGDVCSRGTKRARFLPDRRLHEVVAAVTPRAGHSRARPVAAQHADHAAGHASTDVAQSGGLR